MATTAERYPRSQRILVLVPYCEPSHERAALAQASALAQTIIRYEQVLNGDERDIDQSSDDGEQAFEMAVSPASTEQELPPIAWKIDNKYYTVTVHFVLKAVQVDETAARKLARGKWKDGDTIVNSVQALREASEGVQAMMLCLGSSVSHHVVSLLSEEIDKIVNVKEREIALAVQMASFSQTEPMNETLSAQLDGRQESLEDNFADRGWEYIDLWDGEEMDEQACAGSDEEGQLPSHRTTHDALEDEGVERVRSALMSYMWPGLTRKKPDGVGSFAAAGSLSLPHGSALEFLKSAGRPDLSVRREEQPQKLQDQDQLQDLDLLLQGLPPGAEDLLGDLDIDPTEKDEALAAGFLAKILDFEGRTGFKGIDGDQSDEARRQHAHKALEDFLRAEDSTWPQPAIVADGPASKGASTVAGRPNASLLAFDDDFDDFVEAGANEIDAFNLNGFPSVDALRAEAERVRSIADAQLREEEAARLALMFTGMLVQE